MNSSERRVQFLPAHDSVLEIPSLGEYTEQDIMNCWYTKPEFRKIAKRCQKQARRWESGKPSMNESCPRGLESFMQEDGEITTASVEQCIDAVMDEQEVQWDKEVDDYDRLAAVSEEVSRFSVSWALEKARTDEKEAQRIYKHMEQKYKVTKLKCESPTSLSKSIEDGRDDHTSMCSDLSHPGAESPRLTEHQKTKGASKPPLKMPKLPRHVSVTIYRKVSPMICSR